MSKRVLVTGGTGFIGSHLVTHLEGEQYDVVVLHHSTPSDGSGAKVDEGLEGDITQFESLPSFDVFEAVFHLAGSVSVSESVRDPLQTLETNVHGTENVMERARRDDVDTFVYLSSGSVYGSPTSLPTHEDAPTSPRHPYAASKLAGENIVESYAHTYDVAATSARAFTVYGPGQDSDNLLSEVIEQVESGSERIELGNTEPTRDFVYVEDVCAGLISILEDDLDGYQVYNIGSEEEHSVADVVERVLSVMDSSATIESTARRDESIEIERMVSDCRKLRSIGWEPAYDLDRGIEATVREGIHERR